MYSLFLVTLLNFLLKVTKTLLCLIVRLHKKIRFNTVEFCQVFVVRNFIKICQSIRFCLKLHKNNWYCYSYVIGCSNTGSTLCEALGEVKEVDYLVVTIERSSVTCKVREEPYRHLTI
jgi:hypothetical protein